MDFSKFTDQITKIKVTGVVDKLFIFGTLLIVLGVVSGILKAEAWITIVVFCFGFLFIASGLIAYRFFAIKNPTYLRSEEFHLRQQSIEMLGDKDNYLPIDGKDIVAITNPYNQLEKGKDDE